MSENESRMPIMAHLDELRKRLMYSVGALFVGFVVCFQYSKTLLDWFRTPLTFTFRFDQIFPYAHPAYIKSPATLIFTEPAEAFWMYMKLGFIAGIFLALPFVFTQVWLFISPGLKPKERRYALPFIISATLLFVVGALFCQYFLLPFAIQFLLTYQTEGLTPMISVGKYVDFVSKFLLASGLIFELPLIILILSKLGLVTPDFLAKKRKYAILLSFIVAAILTPTPDMFNQTLMAMPIIVLYEVGIIIARLFGRKKETV